MSAFSHTHEMPGMVPVAPDRPTIGSLWPAAAVSVLGLLVLVALTLTSGGQAGGQYVVMTAPSRTHGAVIGVIHRAGAGVVTLGALPNVAIAWSEDPGFAAAARAQGAWLVTPTSGFAGCGSLQGQGAR